MMSIVNSYRKINEYNFHHATSIGLEADALRKAAAHLSAQAL
jgi:hypothetical protein